MRNHIIIAFLSIMLLGASNSFAYKKGHAVHQTAEATHKKSHEKSHAAQHKSYAAHHSAHHATHHSGHATHHKGSVAHHHSHGAHHKSYAHHKGHGKTQVIEEEVFNYPVARPTPAPAPVPVAKAAKEPDAEQADNAGKEYKCYRAWRKDLKRERKEYRARIKEAEGMPWAAERKMRKAYKKAWKADILEHEYETGGYHEDRPYWWY